MKDMCTSLVVLLRGFFFLDQRVTHLERAAGPNHLIKTTDVEQRRAIIVDPEEPVGC